MPAGTTVVAPGGTPLAQGSACSQGPLAESWAFLRGQQGAGEGDRPRAGASLAEEARPLLAECRGPQGRG